MGPQDITFKLGGLKPGERCLERLRTRWVNFAARRRTHRPAGEPWPVTPPVTARRCQIDKNDPLVDDLDREIRAAWGDEVLSFRLSALRPASAVPVRRRRAAPLGRRDPPATAADRSAGC